MRAIEEIVADIIEAIPVGQIFDENDVIGRLLEKHPADYLKFRARYAHAKHSMDLAAAAVAGEIEKFEGIFVERSIDDTELHSSQMVICECTRWMRI